MVDVPTMRRFVFTIFTLVMTGVSASGIQRAVDPSRAIRLDRDVLEGFPADPYHNGNLIGVMHRPKGKLHRVTWFDKSGFSGCSDDPPGWERRVVQVFDAEGRCVELEDWSMGFRESRRVVRDGADGLNGRIHFWHGGRSELCWQHDFLRDGAGQVVAELRVSLHPETLKPSRDPPTLAYDYTYDASGRVHRVRYFDEAARLGSCEEFVYDEKGRIHVVVHGGSPNFTEYQYDDQDRLRSARWRAGETPPYSRMEYEYDGSSPRVARQRQFTRELLTREITCEYDAAGQLLHRTTWQPLVPSTPGRSPSRPRSTIEVFDGEDRPLLREVYEEGATLIERSRYDYEDDERGNWVRRVEDKRPGPFVLTVWRRIEYAD